MKKIKGQKFSENQVEKASGSRRFPDPAVQKEFNELHTLFQAAVKNKFAIGDLITILVEQKNVKISKIADHFGRKRTRLSEIYHTAKLFEPEMRDYSISFFRYELAKRAADRFNWDPLEALKEIQRKGITQSRKATRHFASIERGKQNAKSIDEAIMRKLRDEGELINRCHYDDCRNVVDRINDGTLKIAWVDAPYGKYGSYKDGHHDKGGAALNTFDNPTTEEVIKLLEDMMRILIQKMSKGGVMLLCRPGGIVDPLHIEITAFAAKYGWEISSVLVWYKGGAKLGAGNEPYTVDTENILVLHRQGETIENHNNSSRSVVLDNKPVVQRSETADESHLFEMPLDLCQFLIEKHSFEGDLVFDACGCTASFSVAAIEAKRQFIYSDTNLQNYNLGCNNVCEAIQIQQIKAG